jgi:hypothetical protein
LTTYTKRLLDLLNDDGILKNDEITLKLSNLKESNFEFENDGDFFGYDGNNFVSYTPPDLSNLASIDYVDASFDNLIDGSDSLIDSFGEISSYFDNNTNYLKDVINPFIKRQKMKVYFSDGIETIYEMDHNSGNIDVFLNGVKLTPRVMDYNDIQGINNLSTDYDFQSLGSSQSPSRQYFTTGHDDPDYGIHWRTNYTQADGSNKRLVDYYSIYMFNNSNLSNSVNNFLTNISNNTFRLQFDKTITETDQFSNQYQKENFSYITKYLGTRQLVMPVLSTEQTVPSFLGHIFSNGPRGQIGSPHYVDFYALNPVNARKESFAIELNFTPNSGDILILRSY